MFLSEDNNGNPLIRHVAGCRESRVRGGKKSGRRLACDMKRTRSTFVAHETVGTLVGTFDECVTCKIFCDVKSIQI